MTQINLLCDQNSLFMLNFEAGGTCGNSCAAKDCLVMQKYYLHSLILDTSPHFCSNECKIGIGYHEYIPTEAIGYVARTTILFSSTCY